MIKDFCEIMAEYESEYRKGVPLIPAEMINACILYVNAFVKDGTVLNPMGEWNPAFAYHKGDAVTYNGNLYLAIADTTAGTAPTDTNYFVLLLSGPPAITNIQISEVR